MRCEPYLVAVIHHAGMGHKRDEILQETFLGLNESVWKTGKMPEKITSFLVVLASRRINDHRRAEGYRREVFVDGDGDVDAMPGSRRNPEEALEATELARVVRQILASLNDDEQEVLIQKELLGMSAEEIAKALGCPSGTVRSRLSKARAKFVDLATRVHKIMGGER